MATGGTGLNFDPLDSAALTEVIRRPLLASIESDPTVGEQIMPFVDVHSREVKTNVREVYAFGKGQFRAPGATPPLYEPKADYKETTIELVLPDEMHRIKDEDWLNLTSSDEGVRRKAGVSLVERGDILAIRNRRAIEDLRWQALAGSVTVTYPTGSTLVIDYGIPPSHKPNASHGGWQNTATADPIQDIKDWQLLSANAIGAYGTKIHMSSEAWELLLRSERLKTQLTGQDRALYIPKKEDVLSQLRAGTEIILTDAGYRDTTANLDRGIDATTRFLPKDKVLITTDYTVEGQRIADTPRGQVLVSTGYNTTDTRQGTQAEVILDHMSKTRFLRVGSAVIPRIHQPGAFVYADVGTVS